MKTEGFTPVKKILWGALLFPCCLMAAGKVASLSPTVTQLVIYLGGSDRLCGRSSACYFPEVSHLPVVVDMGRPYPEAVLQSRAAWVISDARHPDANWKTKTVYNFTAKELQVPIFKNGELVYQCPNL